MSSKPLDELEMFELMQAAYPEKFPDDDDDTWNAAQQFADELNGWDDIADLLGRVSMLTMPISSALTNKNMHCLGKVAIKNEKAYMVAVVKRDVTMN